MVLVTSGDPAIAQALSRDFEPARLIVVTQSPARGTGDAVRVGMSAVAPGTARVLIAYGDTPLIRPDDMRRLSRALDGPEAYELAVMTCDVADPTGRRQSDCCGRILTAPLVSQLV